MRAPELASRDDASRAFRAFPSRERRRRGCTSRNDTKRCLDRGAFWWKTEIGPRARGARPLASLDAAAAAAAGARAVQPDAGPDDALDGAPAPSRSLMGVSPFGLSSPLAGISYEFNRMLPLVDSMMNSASSRDRVEIKPVCVREPRARKSSPSLEALRVPAAECARPPLSFASRSPAPDVARSPAPC